MSPLLMFVLPALLGQSAASPYDVTVTAPTPPRSASQSVRERETLAIAPHKTADDLMLMVPGMFITHHGGEGKASQIFYRGFDAVHGQDVEISVGGVPVNDVSNIHGQGYADLNFIPAELVQQLRALPGTYDPRQGDFAVAGSLQLSLGIEESGITTKVGAGSFGSQRQFLAYRPAGQSVENFAAFEHYSTNGFGPSRAAQRASAVAQSVWNLPDDLKCRVLVSSYSGHFSSAGVLPLADLQSGAVSPFATYDPFQGGASTRTSALAEISEDRPGQRTSLSVYGILRGMRLKQNFTGFLANPSGDLQQQSNDALTVGAQGFFRQHVAILSSTDSLEAGFFLRSDWIEQSQARLSSIDGKVTSAQVQAHVQANQIAAYLDAALHPWSRLTVRGGLRLSSLAFSSTDAGPQSAGQSRSSQGAHLGPKVTVDFAAWSRGHVLFSYGEGFRSPQARSLAESETTPFTKVRSAELGARLNGVWGSASLAGFATRLSEDLVFDPATTRNEAVPGSQRLGAAVDLSFQRWGWLLGNFGGTYTQARFNRSDMTYTKGDLLPYVPQWVARADVAAKRTVAIVKDNPIFAEVGTGWSMLASRPLPYAEMGHDVFLVDASLRIRYRSVAASAQVWNLLDRHWYDGEFVYAAKWKANAAASLVPERFVTVGNPRTVMFDLTLSL